MIGLLSDEPASSDLVACCCFCFFMGLDDSGAALTSGSGCLRLFGVADLFFVLSFVEELDLDAGFLADAAFFCLFEAESSFLLAACFVSVVSKSSR